MSETNQSEESLGRRYQPSEPDVGRIALFAVLLVISVGVALLAMSWTYTILAGLQPEPSPTASLWAEAERLPPQPRLQVVPARDLQTARIDEEALLNSYGWVDPEAGVVRIPIERAIDVLAQRGLPARDRRQETRRSSDRKP